MEPFVAPSPVDNPLLPDRAGTDQVHRALLQMILAGRLTPGSKINQVALAARLGVSRTPLIKALYLLSAQGLVDAAPNRGFLVHRPTVAELIYLWTFREALESMTIYELAERLHPSEIDGLEALFEPFEKTTVDRYPEVYRQADRDFHDRLLALSHNNLAHRINDHFLILDRAAAAGLLRPPSKTLDEHLAVIAALRRRDRQEARRTMVEHMKKTRELVEEAVDRLRRIGSEPESMPVDQLAPYDAGSPGERAETHHRSAHTAGGVAVYGPCTRCAPASPYREAGTDALLRCV